MFGLLNTLVLSYLAGTGFISNASIVTRGMVKAARRAAEGRLAEAGVSALSAITAPSVLAVSSTTSMITEIVEGAYELLGPTRLEAVRGSKKKLSA